MEMICPVCGCKSPALKLSDISCNQCGFAYAYMNYFSGDISLSLWKTKIEKMREKIRMDKMSLFSQKNLFFLSGDQVAYYAPDEKKLLIFASDGSVEEKKNVIQYSRSERNSAILFSSGKIKAQGDNNYGQCNVQGTASVSFLLCAPNCIYVVGEDGRIAISGAVLDPQIKTWTDITALACGSFHVLGLTKDKRVKIAGEMIEQSVVDQVAGWKDVRAICASTDCSIALFEDGTVSFAGRKNDPRSDVENWKDIVSVKADSSYAVGLTREGDVKLAGTCKPFLDMNRSSAANWKDVIAITCSRSSIAAIFADGSLKIVGNFSGDIDTICKQWKDKVKI